jgi:hypothetical protein
LRAVLQIKAGAHAFASGAISFLNRTGFSGKMTQEVM